MTLRTRWFSGCSKPTVEITCSCGERVLNVGRKIGARLHVRALQRIARIDGEDGLGVHVLGPQQELVKAEAIGRAIPPRSRVAGALRQGPECLLPVETVGDLIA